MINELSIIIPTLNEEKYLPRLLNSTLAQDFQGKLQIIVVDGNSKDKTIEIAESYNYKLKDLYVIRAKADIGYQRNLGAQKAKYNHLLFVDADIILPKSLLKKLTKNIDENKNIIEVPLIIPTGKFSLIYILYFLAGLFIGVYSVFSPITSGGFILTTKKNHLKIGGFRQGAVAAEDVDYGERSVKNGAKFKFHYDCLILHSTRRAQKMGILPLMWFYLKGFFYYKRHGVLQDKTKFNYPYGDY